MTDKRKIKKRREEEYEVEDKEVEKPSKDEFTLAKWLKKNVSVKRTKFAGHNVEYFTGSKAVDALMESDWAISKDDSEPFFPSRQDAIDFLDTMLRHKFFHRAKKVPVSEKELKAKMSKKKDSKKSEDDTCEASNTEGKDTDKLKHEDRQKKIRKIKLEMHMSQIFIDNLDAYVWIYDPIPFYYWIVGFMVVLGAIGICLFPLWPPTVRLGVQYLSIGAAGFLATILALAVIRIIVFAIVWVITWDRIHIWLLPNLTEDVGFFASFWPLYELKYNGSNKNKKYNKKKKLKYSDDEDTNQNENDDINKPEDDDDTNKFDDNTDHRNKHDNDEAEENDSVDEGYDKDKNNTNKSDSETDTESSSQQSTEKDFEIIDKEEAKVKI